MEIRYGGTRNPTRAHLTRLQQEQAIKIDQDCFSNSIDNYTQFDGALRALAIYFESGLRLALRHSEHCVCYKKSVWRMVVHFRLWGTVVVAVSLAALPDRKRPVAFLLLCKPFVFPVH